MTDLAGCRTPSTPLPVTHGRIQSGDFVPFGWLRNRHLQTLVANKPIRLPAGPEVEDLRYQLPDGDLVRLVRSTGADTAQHSSPHVIVLHGLAGGYDSAYARELFARLAAEGITGHLLHFRGCGGVTNRLPRGYHAGDTADLAHYVGELRQRFPHAPCTAVGYSLGANVLLKYLGESGSQSRLDAAVAVSVPFDLDDACRSISGGFSIIYQKVLLSRLKRSMEQRFRQSDHVPFDLRAMWRTPSLKAFDDVVTAPIHGFDSADHYYRVSSCRQYLRDIRTPTLIIHAADDPFQSPAGIPTAPELSSSVTLELPRHGGHVGFLGSGVRRGKEEATAGRPWLPDRIVRFLSAQAGGGESR
jgi:predicted alpha/beta-fold hydrolase